mgnify:FL=1
MTSFLDDLFGGLARDHWLYLWTKHDGRSHWFRAPEDLAAATARAELLGERADVYFGVGLGPVAGSAGSRTLAENVSAIAGIWVDIDYRHAAHKKQNLPPTIDAAVELAASMPQPPSMVISTGHGIHAWWLFKEPWELENEAERAEARWMVQTWQEAIRARARAREWDVDPTHDLARIMRLPDTRNFSDPLDVKPVEYLENYPDRRYARTDLELYLLDTDPTLPGRIVPAELPKDWKPGPIQATEKFRLLMEEDEKFKASWEHQRPDFQDQSLSTYDMSIAGLAARAGWTDSEIADLIAEHRRQAGDPSKGERLDYLGRTISVARRRGEIEARVEAVVLGNQTALTSGDPQEAARLRWAQLNVPGVLRWYRVLGDPMEFVLVTVDGELRMSEEVFGTYTAIQRRLSTNLSATLPPMKAPEWWGNAASLARMAEARGEVSDPADLIRAWLEAYIAAGGAPETEAEHRRERLRDGAMIIEGNYVVNGAALMRWVQVTEGEDKLSIAELRRFWVRAGGKISQNIHCEDAEGRRSTVRAWTMPIYDRS